LINRNLTLMPEHFRMEQLQMATASDKFDASFLT
jgi:hypothetical protein